MDTTKLTAKTLASVFDHTFLKAYATHEDFDKLCREAKEIGAAMGIPKNCVLKITHKLVEAGIIERLVGAQGGFSLAQKIDDITLLDILNIMEPTMRVNRCLEEDKFCSRYATENCPVRGFYCKLQEELEKSLKKMTIKRLLADAN